MPKFGRASWLRLYPQGGGFALTPKLSVIISSAMVNNDGLDEIKAATKKIVEIFNTGDFSAVSLLFSSDYIDHQRPTWMKVNGSEEFKQIVTLARKSLPNLKVSIKDLIAENDKVVVRLHWYSINSIGKRLCEKQLIFFVLPIARRLSTGEQRHGHQKTHNTFYSKHGWANG